MLAAVVMLILGSASTSCISHVTHLSKYLRLKERLLEDDAAEVKQCYFVRLDSAVRIYTFCRIPSDWHEVTQQTNGPEM